MALKKEVKNAVAIYASWRYAEGMEVWAHSFLTSALVWGDCWAPHSSNFFPKKKLWCPLVWRLGGTHSSPGHFREETDHLPATGLEPHSSGRSQGPRLAMQLYQFTGRRYITSNSLFISLLSGIMNKLTGWWNKMHLPAWRRMCIPGTQGTFIAKWLPAIFALRDVLNFKAKGFIFHFLSDKNFYLEFCTTVLCSVNMLTKLSRQTASQ